MLGSVSATALGQAYKSLNQDYASVLSQLASGKRVNKASDDFASYTQSKALEADITGYNSIRNNLAVAKGKLEMAVAVGNDLYSDLMELKEIANNYAATSDADEQAAYLDEFAAVVATVDATIADTKYDDVQIHVAGDLIDVGVNPDDLATEKITATFAAADIVSSALFDVTDASTVTAMVDEATSFLTKAEGYLEEVNRQTSYAETAISSKEAAISVLTDVDEVAALNKLVNLQVRQQAAISMISQANMSQQGVLALYM